MECCPHCGEKYFALYAYWLAAKIMAKTGSFESTFIGVKHFFTNGFMRVTERKHWKYRVFCKVEQSPFGKI